MSPLMRAREVAALGFWESDIRGVSILMDKYSQMGAIEADLANSAGAAAQMAAVRQSALDEQLAVAANRWTDLKIVIGAQLAPAFATLASGLSSLLAKMTNFAQDHATFVRLAGLAAAATAGVLALGAGIALAAAGIAAIASYAGVIAIVAGIAAGVAAIAAAAYLVIETWDGVKSFFKGWGAEVLGFIVAPFAMIPIEIYRHIGAIKNAAQAAAGAVAGFFVGHSPIPQRPLPDFNIGRAISP